MKLSVVTALPYIEYFVAAPHFMAGPFSFSIFGRLTVNLQNIINENSLPIC